MIKVVSRIELLIIGEDVTRTCFVLIVFFFVFFCFMLSNLSPPPPPKKIWDGFYELLQYLICSISFVDTRIVVVCAWLCSDGRYLLNRPLRQLLQH